MSPLTPPSPGPDQGAAGAATPIAALSATVAAQAGRIAELEAALAAMAESRTQALAAEQTARHLHADDVALLDAVYANAPIGLAFLDAELRYVRANRTLAEMGGIPVEAYPGRTVGDLFPALAPIIEPLHRHVLTTGEAIRDIPISGTTPATPDAPRNWLASYYPVHGRDGAVVGVGLVAVDVTERKRVEQQLRDGADALRASEQRFRLLAEHASDLIYRYRLSPDPGFEYVSPSATTLTGYTPEDHYADPGLGFKLVHPDDRALLQRLSQDPAAAGAPITLRWQRKDGSVMWTEQINRVITDGAGVPVAIEGIARDVTARRAAEEQVRAALVAEQEARQVAERAAVYSSRLEAIATALSAALTQDAIAAVIKEHGSTVTGARTVTIALLDATEEIVNIIGYVGRDLAVMRTFQGISIDTIPPLAHAIRTRENLWLPSRDEAEAQFPGTGVLMEQLGDQARATLPLVTGGRAIGVISLSYPEPRHFAPEERTLLTTLAQQCAQALDRARLYDEIVETRQRLQHLSQRLLEAQEQERRHIARELHDEVGQVLGALKINLHLLGAQPATPQLAESLGMVDTLIQQVRALSLDLRPSVLDDLGLAAALAWYCDRLQQRSGLRLDFDDRLGDVAVPPMLATACFRIAQEALTNIVRHARAGRVDVALSYQGGMLALAVQDDGIGFDVRARRARATAGESLGLISMTERAELLGGSVEVISAPGEGTEVWAWLPLDAPPANSPT